MGNIFKERDIYKLYKYASNEEKILVYQMGKVGSTTIEESIPNSIHFHTLYNNKPTIRDELKRTGIFTKFIPITRDFILRSAIKNRQKKVKIISMVRDPIKRNISMFFHDFPYLFVKYNNTNKVNRRKEEGLELLKKIFDNSFDHNYQFEWFDKEIKRFTGIDIYKEKYNSEKGYLKVENGNYELFLLKLEDIEKALPDLEDFIQQPIKIKSANRGDKKWYSSLYKDVKEEILNDYKYKEKILNSKFSHFFGYDKI